MHSKRLFIIAEWLARFFSIKSIPKTRYTFRLNPSVPVTKITNSDKCVPNEFILYFSFLIELQVRLKQSGLGCDRILY